eukprot:14932019-Heterocapsa_arctica.AAC.1
MSLPVTPQDHRFCRPSPAMAVDPKWCACLSFHDYKQTTRASGQPGLRALNDVLVYDCISTKSWE